MDGRTTPVSVRSWKIRIPSGRGMSERWAAPSHDHLPCTQKQSMSPKAGLGILVLGVVGTKAISGTKLYAKILLAH